MKYIISILFVLAGVSASAMEVTVKCTPKAFDCFNGDCSWAEMREGDLVAIDMDQQVENPDIWRGRYQYNLDGHLLTLNFRYDEGEPRHPLRVNAYLAASTVMAESSGINSVDIALRNNVYGRGFKCTQIRVRK